MNEKDDKKEEETTPSNVKSLSGPVGGSEGAAAPDPVHMEMVRHLAGMIAPFCPNTTEEALVKLAAVGLQEQAQIHDSIMPTLMQGHSQVGDYPSLRIVVKGPNGREGGILAPKRLEDVEDAQPGIAQAMSVAFLLTPSVRMCLKAWGFQYRIEQVAEDQSSPTPTLHTV